jgi:hypothetical protein
MSDNNPPDIITLQDFNPFAIPFQGRVVTDIFTEYDFTLGVHEILLSGSVGSAKTILMAHLAIKLSLMFPNNHILLCRKTLPALKETLLATCVDHLGLKIKHRFNQSSGRIRFENGSKISCHSWADNKFMKVRSLNISCAFIEELTENEKADFYKEILMRCGRMPHIPINLVMCATNPGAPSHWAYKHWFMSKDPTRKYYKSITEQNPFLKKSYIEKLKQNLTKREADRMLRGEWIELITDMIYYEYKHEVHFKEHKYVIDPAYPIDLMHDFNIGKGKPMSAAVGQHIEGHFHLFAEFHIEGVRTQSIMDEMEGAGIFNHKNCLYRIFGDASGRNNDTRSKVTDYDIIEKHLANLNINYEFCVPKANPPIRRRHNIVNAVFLNDNKEVRWSQYLGTEWVEDGFKLTTFKKGASLIEDDSIPEQHVTTAVGYWVDFILNRMVAQKSSTTQL